MRVFLVLMSGALLMFAGCSAEVSGHADTSGETVPVAVDLSPSALGGGDAKSAPAAPGVDPSVIGNPQ